MSKMRWGLKIAPATLAAMLVPSTGWTQTPAAPALAPATNPPGQTTDDNALRSAEDAFGTSVGRESIGLYNAFSVRGFSPVAAGNVRIEGLYIDAVVVPNGRLAAGSTIRVGISAQGYPFPAPTGIADFRLRLPGDRANATVVVGTVSSGGANADFDVRLPLIAGKLGFAGGVSVNYEDPSTIEPVTHAGAATLLHWQPSPDVELIPFWSHFIHRDDPAQPRFIVAGNFLPPRIDRDAKLVQPWALNDVDDTNYGLITRIDLGAVNLAAGAFRSIRNTDINYSDQFLGVAPSGAAARHRLVASPPQRSAATSGEVRLTRDFADGRRGHRLHLSLRAREQDRRFGGSAAAELGPTSIGDPLTAPRPGYAFGAQSSDRIRQLSGGIAYEGRWRQVGELSLGIQKTDYRKSVEIPGRSRLDTKASPWLYNGAVAVHAGPRLALYAGYTRGLEESPFAPDIAVNRDEAPPALVTRQIDGGMRWAITPKVKLIAGLFDVRKPYFNLDSGQVYRQLGNVRHRGAELSLTGEILPNLQVVGGAVLLDAEVSGAALDAGLIGKRPVGSTRETIILNAEYSPPSVAGLSLDVGIDGFGRRVANSSNSLSVPATATVDAGLRYRWRLGRTPVAVRVQGSNLFNDYSWDVRASNAFYFTAPRQFTIRLTADL